VQRRIWEASVSPGPLPPLEVRVRRRDGSVRTAETVAVRIDFSGEASTLVIGRDITERKQLQSRLMISDRMASMGTLAAGIAHEINNPLAYVIGNLEWASDEIRIIAGGSPSERLKQLAENLQHARTGAEQIARVVRGLRIFSRADAEQRKPLDVCQVLEVAINMSFNEIRHRARLVREFGPVPMVAADEARLCQVFTNLLVNAAQSIREGQANINQIRLVTGTDAAGRAVIEIHDTGAGILPELRSRIFDPFFTTKPVGVGTGLGLAICHGIVDTLGGEISVESEPGRGSVFRVTLPAASGAQPAAKPEALVSSPSWRARILVVDDEPLVSAYIGRMLPDYEVSVVQSAGEALRAIGVVHFDAIICDLMMPDMTGMDLYQRLLETRPELAERFIVMTGGAFTPRAREFLETVKVRRLEKPFRKQELRALLRETLPGVAPASP